MANEPIWKIDRVLLRPSRLQDVSVEICPGITALVGWSGAGKTSLLNLFVGFEQPSSGRVVQNMEKVAWVPQSGGLWPHSTVREHLSIAHGFTRDDDDVLLEAFDLLPKAESLPETLSEGEQSRLAVARALAGDASVFVMDEPLVHVDAARSGKYWRAIREHLAKKGASLIFSSHVPETVIGEATYAICLHEGHVIFNGLVADLYSRPPSEALMDFLGAGNWFSPEEALRWLGIAQEGERCLRPEQLRIDPVETGGFTVMAARFCGSVAQVTLREDGTGLEREFFHRPSAGRLAPGMRAGIVILP